MAVFLRGALSRNPPRESRALDIDDALLPREAAKRASVDEAEFLHHRLVESEKRQPKVVTPPAAIEPEPMSPATQPMVEKGRPSGWRYFDCFRLPQVHPIFAQMEAAGANWTLVPPAPIIAEEAMGRYSNEAERDLVMHMSPSGPRGLWLTVTREPCLARLGVELRRARKARGSVYSQRKKGSGPKVELESLGVMRWYVRVVKDGEIVASVFFIDPAYDWERVEAVAKQPLNKAAELLRRGIASVAVHVSPTAH